MENDIRKRLKELADRSYSSNTYTFTDFLGLAEQSDLHSMEKELSYVGIKLYGGYGNADRIVARFGSEDVFGYDTEYPIVCINIRPLLKKFADDLTHRDFLGALMNLGIERSTIGDIKVTEKEAYIFCLENIVDYIVENLTRVRHTSVMCKVIDDTDKIENIIDEEPSHKQIVISSLRADGVISKVYNLSRNDSLILFQTQKVYINGRLCENNSAKVSDGDVVNARGYGKFAISGEPKDTKKGRISVNVDVW